MQVAMWLDTEEQTNTMDYDGQFYAERLAAAVGRITEAFDWTASDLMKGSKQASLFDY